METARLRAFIESAQNGSIKAAAGDGTTAAATYDSSVEVNEFPKTGVWYTFRTTLRDNRYMLSNGAGEGVVGNPTATPTNAMQWQFVERDGGFTDYEFNKFTFE